MFFIVDLDRVELKFQPETYNLANIKISKTTI